ncbi:MAG: C40 family peptidase [Chitinophagales bacterium]
MQTRSRQIKIILLLLMFLCLVNTTYAKKKKKKKKPTSQTTVVVTSKNTKKDSIQKKPVPIDIESSETKSDVDGLLWFAKQQLGTPYKYASADPKNGGLDCSGFLYYVFQHFKISVPRSSKDYMNFGKTIDKYAAQKGDVIVFTGTDATQRIGGHVGLVLENDNGDITFIHGSSGKANGVTISKLSEGYYTQRFLKVVRVIK